ncbi:MAG: imidazole glycerol-phosphate synthase subunit HisH [Frankiaceae bacterium]|jgi:glutamine amidotransferase|nr:imidazole glycerol-phosphate synthase subunit HisH [Frankiaceae bacterium]
MSGPKVVVYDYGSGNLRSAERALTRAGADVTVTADQVAAVKADGLVVPGVGAFNACMAQLEEVGGRAVVGDRVARERPVLGVCVGMQVLFDGSEEHGAEIKGLGALPGTVRRLRDAPVLPHMGWNVVERSGDSVLLAGIGEEERFYFVHSYAPCVGAPEEVEIEEVTGWTRHGARFASVVEVGALSAVQFHPEKSGDTGAALLRNWVGSL